MSPRLDAGLMLPDETACGRIHIWSPTATNAGIGSPRRNQFARSRTIVCPGQIEYLRTTVLDFGPTTIMFRLVCTMSGVRSRARMKANSGPPRPSGELMSQSASTGQRTVSDVGRTDRPTLFLLRRHPQFRRPVTSVKAPQQWELP